MVRAVSRLGISLLLAGGASLALTATAGAERPAPAHSLGSPGHWTRISSGAVGSIDVPGLFRTGDGVLHVVYPRGSGSADQYAVTAVGPGGTTISQDTVLPSTWAALDSTPVLMAGPSGGLRLVFGGLQSTSPGFYSDGRMYTATSSEAGRSWTLSTDAVGISHSAYASYGTSGVALADGTPIAAFPLNSDLTWHVGTSDATPDSVYTQSGATLYDTAMVRSGTTAWDAWFSYGSTAANTGVFVKQIYPTVGPTQKAPGSSHGTSTLETGRVALAARVGGGIYLAYCSGYPSCGAIRLWRAGSSNYLDVPLTRYAGKLALSAAPGGRLWLAWTDNSTAVRALRTNPAVTTLGAVRTLGHPAGHSSLYTVAIDGTTGKGDVVTNVGDGIWHTQVLPGISVTATPARWRHGRAKRVTFRTRDAGAALAGATIRVGSRHCTTSPHGSCALTFPRSYGRGTHAATASATGYAPQRISLRVT